MNEYGFDDSMTLREMSDNLMEVRMGECFIWQEDDKKQKQRLVLAVEGHRKRSDANEDEESKELSVNITEG